MKVKFFASIREAIQREELALNIDTSVSINELKQQLIDANPSWSEALSGNVLCARNLELCDGNTPVGDQDEVAFFPPVTGG